MSHSYSAGGVVVDPSGRILVVSQNHNSWSLPKGHIDAGETPREAAVREIKEESGITELKLVGQLGVYTRPRIGLNGGDDTSMMKTITMFLFRTDQTKLMPEDPANPEAQWVELDEVASLLTHEKDKDFFLSIIPKVKQLLPQ